ncbi:MAG: exosortase/archaeosortase family protein [Paludibacteraceae bacterium]|jgi:exosortase/archaeosortase family protein|nr:exosortase/archaeosortase family protein [Paludibacteraceae bacterium]
MKNALLKDFVLKLKPFWGMFYFAGMLFVTHYAWKYSFTESLQMGGAPQVWLWQAIDCTRFFDTCVGYICDIIDWFFANVFGVDGYEIYGHRFYILEPVRSLISIVWSCTGLKQLFIFTTMLLCYPYGHKHKCWAIPAFGVVVLLLNLIRLMVLFYHVKNVPSDFEMWHEGSKYIFYAIMFGLWVLWEDIVRKYATRN